MPPRKAKPKKARAPAQPVAPAAPPVPGPARPARRGAKKTVVILSRKRSLYSTSRLVEAIKYRGHRPLVLDTLRCSMILAKGQPRMMYRGVEIRGVDVVIPRIGASITAYGLAVVTHFDVMGVPVVNVAQSIARSRDKLRCLQYLSRAGWRQKSDRSGAACL